MSKPRRATDVIGELNLDFDDAYRVIYEEGMNPDRLKEDDIQKIKSSVNKAEKRRKKAATEEDLKGRSMLVLRNEQERTDLYVLIGPEQKSTHERYYPVKQLIDYLKGKLSLGDLEPIIIKIQKSGKREKGGHSRGTNYESYLTESAFRYIADHAEDLMPFIHMEDSEGIDISHNEYLKSKCYEERVREAYEPLGYQLKEVMKPSELLSRAVDRAKGRVNKDVNDFLNSKDSAFLDDFDVEKYQSNNDAPEVIKWLESQNLGRETAFYIHCLEAKYGEKIPDNKVLGTWRQAAYNAEFTRKHPWAKQNLPKKAKVEEYALQIARHFLDNQEDYNKGDSIRLFDGLYIDGKIENCPRDIFSVRMHYGAPVNYLIVNSECIEAIVKEVVSRIKKREMVPDKTAPNKSIYRGIREGSLEITGENLNLVRNCIEKQLLPYEKKEFENMRLTTDDPISDSYRNRVLRFYLKLKGNEILRS